MYVVSRDYFGRFWRALIFTTNDHPKPQQKHHNHHGRPSATPPPLCRNQICLLIVWLFQLFFVQNRGHSVLFPWSRLHRTHTYNSKCIMKPKPHHVCLLVSVVHHVAFQCDRGRVRQRFQTVLREQRRNLTGLSNELQTRQEVPSRSSDLCTKMMLRHTHYFKLVTIETLLSRISASNRPKVSGKRYDNALFPHWMALF